MDVIILVGTFVLLLAAIALLIAVIVFARKITKENEEFDAWLKARNAELDRGGADGAHNMEMIRKMNEEDR